jgi:hypothetical protein
LHKGSHEARLITPLAGLDLVAAGVVLGLDQAGRCAASVHPGHTGRSGITTEHTMKYHHHFLSGGTATLALVALFASIGLAMSDPASAQSNSLPMPLATERVAHWPHTVGQRLAAIQPLFHFTT